jgi:hypothetical protein
MPLALQLAQHLPLHLAAQTSDEEPPELPSEA